MSNNKEKNLTKIGVKNFKTVSDVELELSHLNILVGANASGKSSILQALHLASSLARQASQIRKDSGTTISANQLDYLPTNEYKKLGKDRDLGNRANSHASTFSFTFADENNSAIVAELILRQAKNAGVSVRGTLPEEIEPLFKGQHSFFSAYIPGISGMPNEEQKQSRRVVMKGCSLGDANFYLRNALLLLDEEKIEKVEEWLGKLISPIKISVEHNENDDLIINAKVTVNKIEIPLELLSMGHLQLIQIFCYLFLFEPKIMLMDEPDIHLHPDVQEKLPKILQEIAVEQKLNIILATHSPFIVRGTPTNSKVYWLEDGSIKNEERQTIELALGWGAFGKKVILFSEDSNTSFIKHIIAQWPEIEKLVAVHPGSGYRNLVKPEQGKELMNTFGQSFKFVIHRDRDSITDSEVQDLINKYKKEDITVWITDYSDIEAYFCNAKFVSKITSEDEQQSQKLIENIVEKFNSKDCQNFRSQRIHINQELHNEGGSPEIENVFNELQNRPLGIVSGKTVFKQIKNHFNGQKFSEDIILSSPLDGSVASSLKTTLEEVMKQH